MIVDSSALLAVLYRNRMRSTTRRRSPQRRTAAWSVANVLEASIVLEGRGGTAAGHELDVFLKDAAIELVPVTVAHMEAARRAWRRFGKGNHPAALNFGDCFAYALADVMDEPLLFKGEDFARTDVETV